MSSAHGFLGGLNPEQLAAVTLPPQHALILAGAGSGKTRVLTTRIAWLLATRQATPASILAVTFTNKAAREMQTRLAAMLPVDTRGMWIGTFHGLCNRFLRAHHREAGLPKLFQILDSADQLASIKRLLKGLGVDDEKYQPRDMQHFINSRKEAGLRAPAVEAREDYTRRRVELYAAYDDQCQREGVVDFAELLLRSFELLSRNEPLRRHYQERFRHILVDEFQDTNVLQYRWLKLLAGHGERRPALPVTAERSEQTPRPSVLPGNDNRAFPTGRPEESRPAPEAQPASTPNPTLPVTAERSEHETSPPAREGLGEGAPEMHTGAGFPTGRPEESRPAPEAQPASTPNPTLPVTTERSEHEASPPAREGLGEGGHIFAVGDDDQSIYRFRGAEVGNMRDFEREFRVAHVIRLEQNYRSQGNILDAANAIIRHNAGRLGKNLWTQAGAGEPIRVFEAFSDGEEARWIVEEVKALARDGHARSEIALLYRSNAQSRILEHSLFSAGIPYRVYGGLRFFERQEIKHALAYLRLIANPDDDTAFARVVNFPARGIGARSLENLQDAARAAGSSLHAAIPAMTGKAGASLAAFAALLARLRDAAHLPLPELVDHVAELSGLREHYRNEKEGQDRLENLDELVNAAANFVAEEGAVGEEGELSADLAAFLSHAALEAGEHQAGEGEDALQLMTVHSAKGLEFNVVFISGLEEGLFPHENSLLEDGGLDEERRLMYVAVTRARQRLYLSFAQTRMLHGQTRYNLQSRFLAEVPAGLLKWLTPRQPRGGYAAESPAASYGMPPPAPADRGGGFRIGQTVEHPKFGTGIIVNAEGMGHDARVQVNFATAGMKWLALSVARLTAA